MALALAPMTAWPMEPPGASYPGRWTKPLRVSPLSGHLACWPIILPSETTLAAQRPESQVHGRIDWPCQSIVIDWEFLKAGPLMVINVRARQGG